MPSLPLISQQRGPSGNATPIKVKNYVQALDASKSPAIRQEKPSQNQPARFQAGARDDRFQHQTIASSLGQKPRMLHATHEGSCASRIASGVKQEREIL